MALVPPKMFKLECGHQSENTLWTKPDQIYLDYGRNRPPEGSIAMNAASSDGYLSSRGY